MGNAVKTLNADEKNRILNILQMYTNGALTAEGQQRIGIIPLLCKMVIAIRQLNRKSLDQIADRNWHKLHLNISLPRANKPVWLRYENGTIQIESDGLSEQGIRAILDDPEDVYWMYEIEL